MADLQQRAIHEAEVARAAEAAAAEAKAEAAVANARVAEVQSQLAQIEEAAKRDKEAHAQAATEAALESHFVTWTLICSSTR